MKAENEVVVDSKDLYQFLVTECRYGYKRNNHLMPDCAYDHVKLYLPKMLVNNKSLAIHTAQQLCEECISDQISANFFNGEDDEFGNRAKSITFVEYLLQFIRENDDKDWVPYNNDLFENNLAEDYKLKYKVYLLDDTYEGCDIEDIDFDAQKLLVDRLICKLEIADVVFDYLQDRVKTTDFTYNKQRVVDNLGYVNFKYILKDKDITILVRNILC